MAQKTKEGSNKKGLAARILGGQPTSNQKKFFWFMILSLTLWPMFFSHPFSSLTLQSRLLLKNFADWAWS